MAYTVTQLARFLDVSTNTIRNWARDFAAHLSPDANPPKGTPRQYSEEDAAVLQTVAILRLQGVELDDIATRIEAGERLEFQDRPATPEEPAKDAPEAPGVELVTQSFAAALQRQDSQISRLMDQLEELRAAHLEAEKRAIAAETELRVLRELQAREDGKGEEKPPRWQFWRR